MTIESPVNEVKDVDLLQCLRDAKLSCEVVNLISLSRIHFAKHSAILFALDHRSRCPLWPESYWAWVLFLFYPPSMGALH